ncbi:MFS transporter [Falsiroseomonas selenitidurans]|uniref:Lysosomal dipeptide transporter MFSD1 n=1 Tax=Falsiroseomonas selenitidurans TaxID=2716335 RepID=A0ABX1E8P4_9PROT|nr:MFS transporter [Falsiroseomonas selenitidurans]NKC33599.1 MFS transporter [Falsiroseomonas selenitidurans]
MAETIAVLPPAVPIAPVLPRVEPKTLFIVAWALCLVFYFLQYALRSAPGVMIPELTTAFGLTTLGIGSLLGLYYYTYAAFALVSGASLDRYGAKMPVFIGILATAIGSVLFGLGSMSMAEGGRLLQGAGSAFAFTAAVYLAVHGFSAKWLATAVGVTQLAGMLGGFAGQFAVSPLVHGPLPWQSFWLWSGAVLVVLALVALAVTPSRGEPATGGFWSMFAPYKVVLTNPQSYLCGVIGGLLFMPTTIGDMIWGVPFLPQGLGVPSGEAVMRASMVPLGWVIGAPLLGYLADRIGRRKPVLFGGIGLMLISGIGIAYFGEIIPPYLGGLLFGIGSGAAMIPYTIIKEANPDKVKGSATGAMNFLVFSLSAFLAPVFGLVLMRLSGGNALTLADFRTANGIWVGAILLSLVLTFFLRETGTGRRA